MIKFNSAINDWILKLLTIKEPRSLSYFYNSNLGASRHMTIKLYDSLPDSFRMNPHFPLSSRYLLTTPSSTSGVMISTPSEYDIQKFSIVRWDDGTWSNGYGKVHYGYPSLNQPEPIYYNSLEEMIAAEWDDTITIDYTLNFYPPEERFCNQMLLARGQPMRNGRPDLDIRSVTLGNGTVIPLSSSSEATTLVDSVNSSYGFYLSYPNWTTIESTEETKNYILENDKLTYSLTTGTSYGSRYVAKPFDELWIEGSPNVRTSWDTQDGSIKYEDRVFGQEFILELGIGPISGNSLVRDGIISEIIDVAPIPDYNLNFNYRMSPSKYDVLYDSLIYDRTKVAYNEVDSTLVESLSYDVLPPAELIAEYGTFSQVTVEDLTPILFDIVNGTIVIKNADFSSYVYDSTKIPKYAEIGFGIYKSGTNEWDPVSSTKFAVSVSDALGDGAVKIDENFNIISMSLKIGT